MRNSTRSIVPLRAILSALALASFACSPPAQNNPDVMSVGDTGVVETDTPPSPTDAGGGVCPGPNCPMVTQLSVSQNYSCALLAMGEIRCWGANSAGQQGDGTMMDHTRPTAATFMGAVEISTGYEHMCARRADGTVWCWGAGTNGQLGNGMMSNSLAAVQVMGINTATKIVAGLYASCALLANRTVQCWGRGTDLGNGTGAQSATPVMVQNLPDATDIAMGSFATGPSSMTTCALRTGGGVRCWGNGMDGQIGDGARNSARSATDVMGITNARALDVGGRHACAVLMDNTVRCWGNGQSGELGEVAMEIRTMPVPVVGLANAQSVSLGDWFSCAILMDGLLSCWGEGGRAQLGRGMIPAVGMGRFPMPAPVVNLTAVRLHGAGIDHACAVTGDGTTWCWGDNANGELGDGTTSAERFPTPRPVRW